MVCSNHDRHEEWLKSHNKKEGTPGGDKYMASGASPVARSSIDARILCIIAYEETQQRERIITKRSTYQDVDGKIRHDKVAWVPSPVTEWPGEAPFY